MIDETAATTAESVESTDRQTGAQGASQENIGNIVAKESRKAVEKLLKDAGILPGENPEMQLRDYKKWLDAQMRDLEDARGARDAALTELETLKRKFAAVSGGIPGDRADDYIALASTRMTDGISFERALADYPLTPKQIPPPYAATGSAPLMGGGARGEISLNKSRITK